MRERSPGIIEARGGRTVEDSPATLVTITLDKFWEISSGIENPKYPSGIWYWNPLKIHPNSLVICRLEALYPQLIISRVSSVVVVILFMLY
jgi:hypothetical protein